MEAAIATAVAGFGGIDMLVNNAGVGVFAPVADTVAGRLARDRHEHHRRLQLLPRGASAPARRGGGWIINISSLSGKNPFADGAAYCASKAALNAFSEALMQEVRHDGIRVAYVLPGSVDTEFGGRANTKSEWALQPEDVARGGRGPACSSRAQPAEPVEIRPSRPPRKG